MRTDSERAHQWAADIRQLRDSLDPVSASALQLIYEQHASPAELRTHFGLNESQIKSTVASALQKFAAALLPAAGTSSTRDSR